MPLEGPRGPLSFALFDLDDTLVPWQTVGHWQWAWRPRGPILPERHARSALRRALHRWDRRRWRGLVGAEPPADARAYDRHLRETLAAVAGHELPEEETSAVLARFLKPTGEVERYADVDPLVRRLEAAGVRAGIVTHLPAAVARWAVRRTGLPESLLVLAGDDPDAPSVPAAEGFRAAAKRLGGRPSEGCFVGDLYWSDTRAAARVGFAAVLVDRPGTTARASGRRVAGLGDLETVLRAPEPEEEAPAEPDEPE